MTTFMWRTSAELVDDDDPAWPLVEAWVASATNRVEILPAANTSGDSLVAMQVTTRSPLGAVVYHTGGLLIDEGWLRILGSGHPRLSRSLPSWNAACRTGELRIPPPWVLIADDVLGGLFALNGGRFAPPEVHTVWYFAPDTLEWEDTGKGYADFLRWCLLGDLQRFYTSFRWSNWQAEVRDLSGDSAFRFVPPLSVAGGPIDRRVRTVEEMGTLFRANVGAV